MYDTEVIDAHYCTCVQTYSMYSSRNEPSCKPQTSGDNDVSVGPSVVTNVPLGGGWGRRQGVYGSALYVPFYFAVNPEILQKINFKECFPTG